MNLTAIFTKFLILVILLIAMYFAWFPVPKTPGRIDMAFVVTLERTQRKAIPLQKQLDDMNIPYEIYFGFDGKTLESMDTLPPELERFRGLRNGAIGCWVSHLSLWHRIAQMPEGSNVLILEDDAKITSDFTFPSVPYDIVYYGSITLPDWMLTISLLGKTSHFLECTGHCTHAYLVNPEGARKLLNSFERFPDIHHHAVDIFMTCAFYKDLNIRVLCSVPPNVHQRDLPTEIQDSPLQFSL